MEGLVGRSQQWEKGVRVKVRGWKPYQCFGFFFKSWRDKGWSSTWLVFIYLYNFKLFLTVVTVNDTQVGRQRFSNVYQALKNRTISAFYPKNGFFSVKTFSVSGSIGLVFLTRLFWEQLMWQIRLWVYTADVGLPLDEGVMSPAVRCVYKSTYWWQPVSV